MCLSQVPNASPTAASASSDMYGAAVLDACEQIRKRMGPIASKHNFGSFAEVSLSAPQRPISFTKFHSYLAEFH